MSDVGERQQALTVPVVLVGMPGCGKTSVGTALAEMLGVPFRDTDEALVAAARMSIAEIFERDGEAFFRAREGEVLRRLLDEGPGVLSTGGGAFLRAENRQAIAKQGVSVWLRVPEALLWQRVRHRNSRPLLRTANPRQTLTELMAAREPFYAKAALVVDGQPEFTVPDMARRLVEVLKDAGVVR
ncbi:shikimate kinase [Jannaschia formosa]|uniref:shikimate kinase n=1 Tax=Jannaschia formosa TaxID=2259592 RepID=UPI000E1C3D08|nr:shikimate kinase [Jannaschia formosa]TFL18528.1 shikimate kinase [Jannaschia formosa]